MGFDEWHMKQLNGDTNCPHEAWERKAWNAALMRAAQVPSGWVLVPEMPTPEMLRVAGEISGATRGIQDRRCWLAMIAAAPKFEP